MNQTLFRYLDQSCLHKSDWVPTREAGLARLAAFTPKARLIYAHTRSTDFGPEGVVELQTKGRHYLARSQNIKARTNGRFNPSGQLNETALPLMDFDPAPGPASLSPVQNIISARVGLLILQDDLHPESLDLQVQMVGRACLRTESVSEPSLPQTLFFEGALVDASTRVEVAIGVGVAQLRSDLEIVAWTRRPGVKEIITAYAPIGLVGWCLKTIPKAWKEAGMGLVQMRCKWYSLARPLATGGFFKLVEKPPQLTWKVVQT